MVKVLSFDVGIKNLGVCIVEYTDQNRVVENLGPQANILFWDVLRLGETTNENNYALQCIKLLDEYPQLLDVNIVLIEKQPYFNPKMRSLSMVLQTYFIIRGIKDRENEIPIEKVVFFSPRNKLKVYCGPYIEVTGKQKYTRTKKLGIQHCKKLVEHLPEKLEFFNKLKKKDDAADAFLQGLCYIYFELKKTWGGTSSISAPNSENVSSQQEILLNKIIKSRATKPTEKQHKARYYSCANIHHELKNIYTENIDDFRSTVHNNKKICRSIVKLCPFLENAVDELIDNVHDKLI